MKGLKQVLVRVLKCVEAGNYDGLLNSLDSQIKNQNLQSSSCIKAINSFVRNPKKAINQDDLANSMSTYETDFAFIKEDIEKYRVQRIKSECFSVLHPWAYDLDQVDFKYIINVDINQKILATLKKPNAQVFWISNFKCQAAVSADDFFQALRESWQISKASQFDEILPALKAAAIRNDYVFSIATHAAEICDYVEQVCAGTSFNVMNTQLKTYEGAYQGTNQIKALPAGFDLKATPTLSNGVRLLELTPEQKARDSDMQRRPFDCLPNQAATHKLNLAFEAVDTEEIKGLSINFDGASGIYKIGEGDANHY